MSDWIFARRLRALRETAGLTQQDLAGILGRAGTTIHRSAIAKIEAGDRAVTVGEAVQLARALGVTLAELADPDTGQDRELAAAQVQVRALEYEAAERRRTLEEAQILYQDAAARLAAAEQALAGKDGQ